MGNPVVPVGPFGRNFPQEPPATTHPAWVPTFREWLFRCLPALRGSVERSNPESAGRSGLRRRELAGPLQANLKRRVSDFQVL